MIVQDSCTILQIWETGDAGTSEEATMDLMNRPQSEREARRAQASREELAERIARAVREDGAVEAPGGLRLLRRSSPTRGPRRLLARLLRDRAGQQGGPAGRRSLPLRPRPLPHRHRRAAHREPDHRGVAGAAVPGPRPRARPRPRRLGHGRGRPPRAAGAMPPCGPST